MTYRWKMMIHAYCCKSTKSGDEGWLKWVENILPGFHDKSHKIYSFIHTYMGPGKHKMLSKLATQSFHILRLIARNPNLSRPKVPYFNVLRLSWRSRLSRLHEVICIYVFRHTSLFMPLYRNIFLYIWAYIYVYCLWIWKSESMMNQLTNWHG